MPSAETWYLSTEGSEMSETFERRPETGGDYVPLGAAELIDHDDRSLRVRAGSTNVEVTALAADLFRVGMFPAGGPPKYDSEAIAKEDWGLLGTPG
jgi:alpha-glucosidase